MELANELLELKYKLGILQRTDCTWEEDDKYRSLLRENKPLPDGILYDAPSDGSLELPHFYKVQKANLSKEELAEYVQYKQLKSIVTIKNCLVFFTVLTILSLVGGIITAIAIGLS